MLKKALWFHGGKASFVLFPTDNELCVIPPCFPPKITRDTIQQTWIFYEMLYKQWNLQSAIHCACACLGRKGWWVGGGGKSPSPQIHVSSPYCLYFSCADVLSYTVSTILKQTLCLIFMLIRQKNTAKAHHTKV